MYNALNIGTDTPTSIRSVVQVLAQLTGSTKKIEFCDDKSGKSMADTDHQLDLSLTRSVLGWAPHISLKEGLHLTVNSMA